MLRAGSERHYWARPQGDLKVCAGRGSCLPFAGVDFKKGSSG